MNTPNIHPVTFAGAGPGDPELITVKAMKALETADYILYAGSLVPEAVLVWNCGHAESVSSAGMSLNQIVGAMASNVKAGKRVVRLHTGDPSLYGAIFEQMRELNALDIPYRVVPGVTAAFAAAAAMNMEYTLPEVTQTLILTRISGRTPVPELERFESLASHQAAMAIYLSIGQIEKAQAVIETHYGETAECAIAYKVTHPQEKILFTRACDLAETCRENRITRHALIIVGRSVAACRDLTGVTASRLYDAGFSHGYRSAEQD